MYYAPGNNDAQLHTGLNHRCIMFCRTLLTLHAWCQLHMSRQHDTVNQHTFAECFVINEKITYFLAPTYAHALPLQANGKFSAPEAGPETSWVGVPEALGTVTAHLRKK